MLDRLNAYQAPTARSVLKLDPLQVINNHHLKSSALRTFMPRRTKKQANTTMKKQISKFKGLLDTNSNDLQEISDAKERQVEPVITRSGRASHPPQRLGI